MNNRLLEWDTVKLTTPNNISDNINKFLKNIGISNQPQYLKYTCESSDYKARYCLDNCELEKTRTGCDIIYGWVIWENIKRKHITAEFHSVIKKQTELIDITPRVDGEEKVLFVKDQLRIPKKVNDYTWSTWSNFESRNGHVVVKSEAMEKHDFAKKWPFLKKVLLFLTV